VPGGLFVEVGGGGGVPVTGVLTTCFEHPDTKKKKEMSPRRKCLTMGANNNKPIDVKTITFFLTSNAVLI
jgi:hypothetical protein